MGSQKGNIFVVGLDPFNQKLLERLSLAKDYRFVGLLDTESVVRAPSFDIERLLDTARQQLNAAKEPLRAIVGYWDFPTTLLLAILRHEYGQVGPSLESVLRCEHKYWSRICQREAIPEATPRFQLLDPFTSDAEAVVDLPYPFWLKPVKSHSSHLGFGVRGPADLEYALGEIRAKGGRFGAAFGQILEHADLPPEIRRVGPQDCLVEEMISTNWQCTLEGWVQDGEVHVYGIVDSLREGPVNSSLSRYRYPSVLPNRARRRMKDCVSRLIERTGLNDSPFNAEFFYDEVRDRVQFLEINARASKSHSPLFERVDGVSNLEVVVATALGQRPRMLQGQGPNKLASKFMVRVYEDGIVTQAPTDEDIQRVKGELPDVDLQTIVVPGMRLSELPNQDSYTYEIADLFIGANDEQELLQKYHRALELLPIEIETLREGEPQSDLPVKP